MKKIFIFSLLIAVSCTNGNAILNKENVKGVLEAFNWFNIADLILPQKYKDRCKITLINRERHLWPQTTYEIEKPEFLRINEQDTAITFDIPMLLTHAGYASIQETPGLASALIEGIKRILTFEAYMRTALNEENNAEIFQTLKEKEAMIFALEFTTTKMLNYMINNAIKEDCIIKRLLKILLFSGAKTAISQGVRSRIFDEAVINVLPDLKVNLVNNLIEEGIIQTAGYVFGLLVENPESVQQKKLNNQIQNILDNYPVNQFTQTTPSPIYY